MIALLEGWVCPFVSKFKPVFMFSDTSSYESFFIEIDLGNSKHLVVVLYLPYGNLDSFEDSHRDVLLNYSNIIVC